MASVQDMIEIAELLKVRAIDVDEDRCVRVRNRNSTCTKCTDACIRSVITTGQNEVRIDSTACVNCGACVAVCPTHSLLPLEPSSRELSARIGHAVKSELAMVVIACARKASRHEVDSVEFAEVPCLGHMSERVLLDTLGHGVVDIVLVDGNCTTCKYGVVTSAIDEVVDNVAAMVEAVGGEAIVTRTSDFPPELFARTQQEKKPRNLRGEDRRGLLFQTGGYVRKVASNVAKKTIEDKMGASAKDKPRTLQERLGAGKSGKMPSFSPEENFAILEAMERIAARSREYAGDPIDQYEILVSRHFGSISIDNTKCSGCGLCVLFCPTEALKYAEYDEPTDESKKYLEFQASFCTQCRLCEDVCIRKCLEISSSVDIRDLFDFEPVLVEINKPQERFSILDYRRNKK